MKKIIAFWFLVFSLFLTPVSAQIYLNSNSRYKPLTYEELARPVVQAQQAFDQTVEQINDLSDYIIDVLLHDIDNQLRQEMNQELKLLDKVESNLFETGHVGNAKAGYNSIYRNVRNEIAAYNNRLAQAREREVAEEKARKAAEERARKAAEERAKTEQQNWSGSGFALKDGYVVTNYHVVAEAKSIAIRGIKGNFDKSYTASVISSDKINDLALLKISDPSFQGFGAIPYSIPPMSSEVGEDIFVLGYPLITTMGDEIKLTTGVISSKTGFQGDVALYQISAPIQPGNSGGPLFDKKGNIIGVVNSRHRDADNVGYAIKSMYLRNLIESCNLSSIIPISNTISNLPLVEKVKLVKKFVFTIYCSSEYDKNNANISKSDNFKSTRIITNPGGWKAKGSEDLYVRSITLTPTETILDCSCKNPLKGGWMNISRDAYIQVSVWGDKYKLLKAEGIAFAPDYTYFSYPNQTLTFKLYFPAIPSDAKTLDFFESLASGWRIFNMNLK